MKKRILFVDDEQLVLQGLQRMLRPMRNEWEMVFVDNGAWALELMTEKAFDVVISDMRMPGMNGAELLGEVLKRWPKTVRLVLSGHADHDLVLKCVGSTHQYLSKPCEPDELKGAINRAGQLERSLRDQNLRQLVSKMDRLPSMPSLYVDLVNMLQDPEISMETVGELVGKDMGMTAKILKLVNSAFFGLGRQISSPTEAVLYLGMDTIKSLVLSINAFSQFPSSIVGNFSIEALWSHSQNTAGLAKEIARLQHAELKMLDEAFVAGLLHDIGKLVLASNFPGQYDEVLAAGRVGSRALLAAEENTFGANHADVAGYMLGLWGLPVPVVEAIALHHHPGACDHLAFSPLTAVHAANALVNSHCSSVEQSGAVEELDWGYLRKLGVDKRVEEWRSIAEASLQHLTIKV
ncbi:MAG TPA: response regulator [Patescibacteria group bacterium]|nr:response regulator [Patescibacteria group bacterium]